MKKFIGLIPFFGCLLTQAQQISITGTLQTTSENPVAHASVWVKDTTATLISYTVSDSLGHFSIDLSAHANPSGMLIEINHLGYKSIRYPIQPNKTNYIITLEEQAIDLATVEVKSPPKIQLRNDTLRYDVQSFTKGSDRTIGDVLKHMPGIEVEESGQIKYNGQNISNFYIDGDDLLNDRYNIGTKTIPHDMVQNVEVLQNHQPISVLRDKMQSDDIALNLKIKESAKLKLNGQLKAGGGIPGLYDAELNSILFNKEHKMLYVAKANNVGKDLATDFTAFQAEKRLQAQDNRRPDALLSGGTIAAPTIPKAYYYFNNSISFSANNLMNLKNGYQLKSNINLWHDRNDMQYHSTTELYLNDDTIAYREMQDLNNKPLMVNTAIQLKANKDHYYFSNILQMEYEHEQGNSWLTSNDRALQQLLKSTQYDFSNTLEYIPELKNKNILQFNWYLNYYKQPQTLSITPGINEAVLNDSLPYASAAQWAETPTWFNHITASYRIPKGKIKQNYTWGLKNEWQHVQSALILTQLSGRQTPFEGTPANHLFWNRHNFSISAAYEYEHGPWECNLTLPFAWQYVQYKDDGFMLDELDKRLLFNPFWRLKYYTNQEDYFSLHYAFNNRIGSINDIYQGAILTNYRNLQQNHTALQTKEIHNADLRYNFQRSLQMLFINAGINYSHTHANTINYLEITDDISQVVQLPYQNSIRAWEANAGISKYLFDIGIRAGCGVTWNETRYSQFLNDQLLPFSNQSLALTPSLETQLFDQISLNYDGKLTWTTSKLLDANGHLPERQIKQLDQQASVSYVPFMNTFIKLSGRQLINQQPNATATHYFFTDLGVRYAINPWKADIELTITNITNLKYYETYSLLANQFHYSQYELRGRMALLKLSITL